MKKKLYFLIIIFILVVIIQHCVYSKLLKEADRDKVFFRVNSESLGINYACDYSLDIESEKDNGEPEDMSAGYSMYGGYGGYNCKITISKEKIQEVISDYIGDDLIIYAEFFCANEMDCVVFDLNIEQSNNEKNKIELTPVIYYEDSGDKSYCYSRFSRKEIINLNSSQKIVKFNFKTDML